MERGLHDRFDSISEGVPWESSRGEGGVYEKPGITNLPFLPVNAQFPELTQLVYLLVEIPVLMPVLSVSYTLHGALARSEKRPP